MTARQTFETYILECIDSEEGQKQALEYDEENARYKTDWVHQRYCGWSAALTLAGQILEKLQ